MQIKTTNEPELILGLYPRLVNLDKQQELLRVPPLTPYRSSPVCYEQNLQSVIPAC